MTDDALRELFDTHEDKFLDNVSIGRRDVHAFVLLNRLIPGTSNIVAAAEHDEIYLGVDLETLAKAATEDDVIMLIRCGVRLDSDTDSLTMFV